MTNISTRAATARETSRSTDGKFGHQAHDRASGIDLYETDWAADDEDAAGQDAEDASICTSGPEYGNINSDGYCSPHGLDSCEPASPAAATVEEAEEALRGAFAAIESGEVDGERLASYTRAREACASVDEQDLNTLLDAALAQEGPARAGTIAKIAKMQVASKQLDDTEDALADARGGQFNSRTTGSKYERESSDVAAIAKKVRVDIREAQRQGAVPPGKTSVRIDRFAGGQAVRITAEMDPDLMDIPDPDDVYPKRSKYQQRVDSGLQALSEQYGYDESDTMTDLFIVNHYTSVQIQPAKENQQ